jgi:hypothetical protein
VLCCGSQNGALRHRCETFFFRSLSYSLSPPSTPARAVDCHALAQSAFADTMQIHPDYEIFAKKSDA